MRKYLAVILSFLICHYVTAQDSLHLTLPTHYLEEIGNRMAVLSENVEETSLKAITALRNREEKLKRKLRRIDSGYIAEVFGNVDEVYSSFSQSLQQKGQLREYIPYLDTLKTSIEFFRTQQLRLSTDPHVIAQIQNTLSKVQAFEQDLVSAQKVNHFLTERKNFLRAKLSNLPLGKELAKYNKVVYYYRAQINSYKEAINDSRKRERMAIDLLRKTKPFQDFMTKHSELSKLFFIAGSDDDSHEANNLQGLQTKASTDAIVESRLGKGVEAETIFQKKVQEIPLHVSSLKDLAVRYGMGSIGNGSENMDMPDFKPNAQKTRSFGQRLEYGINLQSRSARILFPVTLDIGLSIGYLIDDKNVIGLGVSYKPGLGNSWKDIKFSSEGIGFRSFLDVKVKASFFLSGGYEQNYWTSFNSISQLKNYSAWQYSGLIGVTKKYSLSKKVKGNAQLLWDFLSYYQVPRTQALIFRVGYSLR
jgi:hypothetical protein